MKIFYHKNKYGYFYEIDVQFCCPDMEQKYDFSHRNSWCVALGHKSGKVRIYGEFDYKENKYKHFDILHCPFCGERIWIIESTF